MKIGLLTFHCADNFGAVLQTYALQEIIKNKGYNIEIINYNPDFLIQPYKSICWINGKLPFMQRILSLGKSILTSPVHIPLGLISKKAQSRKFEMFRRKYLNISQIEFDSINRVDYNYDIYIFGSDQVWNPQQTGMDTIYFGDFKIKKNAIKVSYAASMSNYNNSDKVRSLMNTYLSTFSSISVREIQLKTYLSSNFNIESSLVLDPTLAVDKSTWDKLAVKPKIKDFVLIYNLGMRDVLWEKAKCLAREKKLKIIEVSSFYGRMTMKDSVVSIVSPEEFVGLFKYADYVVTNSFHGTAFSIIFEKQFYVVKRGTDNDSRAISLLRSLGMSKRLILKTDSVDITDYINYSEVTPALDEIRKTSNEFIDYNILACN